MNNRDRPISRIMHPFPRLNSSINKNFSSQAFSIFKKDNTSREPNLNDRVVLNKWEHWLYQYP